MKNDLADALKEIPLSERPCGFMFTEPRNCGNHRGTLEIREGDRSSCVHYLACGIHPYSTNQELAVYADRKMKHVLVEALVYCNLRYPGFGATIEMVGAKDGRSGHSIELFKIFYAIIASCLTEEVWDLEELYPKDSTLIRFYGDFAKSVEKEIGMSIDSAITIVNLSL